MTILFSTGLIADGFTVTLALDFSDGGKNSTRHINTLLNHLQEMDCPAELSQTSDKKPPMLRFDPTPISEAKLHQRGYNLLAQAKTLQGKTQVQGAILVHASTGIHELSSLQGAWVSFITENSWVGYKLPQRLLKNADVTNANSNFYFAGNHVGALAALLHNDVQVAVIAEPLARRWADYNNLSIIAETKPIDTGGWWIREEVPLAIQKSCRDALVHLTRDKHKALPAWIDGFISNKPE